MKVQERVAWNLRRLRVERGLSQEKLAIDAELERRHVGAIERAEENPTVATLDRLAAILGVDVVELLVRPRPGAKAPHGLRPGRRKTK
jgi:transcriptional regulator with XRE-family HTH domain